MNMQSKSYGYYSLNVTLPGDKRLFQSNNERAFVITQLQDLLSPRLLLNSVPAHKQLASCIDLLAFSITAETIQLLIFAIDISVISYFMNHLVERLIQYQQEYSPSMPGNSLEPSIHIKKLRGPHQTLARSIELHMLHEDWEYDRYSSIGFYLHDRRGDWMRTWRLAQLYGNDSNNYRLLAEERLKQIPAALQPRLRSFVA